MWKFFTAALSVTVVVLIVTGDWRASLVTGIVFTALTLVVKAGMLVVPEHKVAVIRNRLDFYTGLRRPGLGFILPLWEHVATYLELGPKPAQFVVSGIHTHDGVPVTFSLRFFYRLSPWDMTAKLRPHLIDDLERSAPAILQRQAEHLLLRLAGQQGIATLLQPEVRAHLEDCLSEELPYQVKRLGIEILDRVMLGSISLPETVQVEINLVQQTRMRARARADSLNTLRETLAAQPRQAWDKVIEVEAIDALARYSVPVFFPYSTDSRVGVFRSRVDGNN